MAQFKVQENKVITALITVVFSLTGVAYTNVTKRMTDLEVKQKDASPIETALQVQTAVLVEQTKTLKVNSEKFDVQIATVLANQQTTADRLQDMADQLAIIRRLFGHDSRDYQAALQRWQDLVASQATKKKK